MCSTGLHMWTKFSDDWLQTATCIAENVTISFKHEYRRPTLTLRCDATSDVINIKSTFSGIICNDLSVSDVKISLSEIIYNLKFSKWPPFWGPGELLNRKLPRKLSPTSNRPYPYLHFELLIDVLAKKIDGVMAMTYFFTQWPSSMTYLFVNVTCWNCWPITYVDQVWWWYVKAFMSYAWQNGQTNRQTNGQTNILAKIVNFGK